MEDRAAGSLVDWDDSLWRCSCYGVFLEESCCSLELAYCFVLSRVLILIHVKTFLRINYIEPFLREILGHNVD